MPTIADLGCAVVGPEASVKQAVAMSDAEAQPVRKKPTIQVSSRFIRQIRLIGAAADAAGATISRARGQAAWQKTKILRRLVVHEQRKNDNDRKRDSD